MSFKTKLKAWQNHYVKPKEQGSYYNITVEGRHDRETAIIRDLMYNGKDDYFYDREADQEYARKDILQWQEQIQEKTKI